MVDVARTCSFNRRAETIWAVNSHGGFGVWGSDVSRNSTDIHEILQRKLAVEYVATPAFNVPVPIVVEPSRNVTLPAAVNLAGCLSILSLPKARCADGVPEIRRRTDTKSRSRIPRIEQIHSHAVKVNYIPSRDGQTVHKGRGCDESVSIGARVRHVKRRASLGNSGVNR
jgi:hypothetical protein